MQDSRGRQRQKGAAEKAGRPEDLPGLCHALLARICKESGFQIPRLADSVLQQLRVHNFDGNVRELENILHRAVALSEGGDLHLDVPDQPKHQPTQVSATPQATVLPSNLQDYLDAQERDILTRVLHDTRYNRTAAAIKLGMSLRQIRYRIARLDIAMPDGDVQANNGDGVDDQP